MNCLIVSVPCKKANFQAIKHDGSLHYETSLFFAKKEVQNSAELPAVFQEGGTRVHYLTGPIPVARLYDFIEKLPSILRGDGEQFSAITSMKSVKTENPGGATGMYCGG